MPTDEMVEKVARDAAKKMFFGLDPIDCHDDSDTYLVTFDTAVKHIAAALSAASAEPVDVRAGAINRAGPVSIRPAPSREDLDMVAVSSPPIRDEPVAWQLRVADRDPPGEWVDVPRERAERLGKEPGMEARALYTSPPSEAAIRADERAAIRIWAFHKAPGELCELSPHGGDEDWIAVVPKLGEYGYVPFLEDCDRWFGCCSISHHEHPNYPDCTICIGAHA